MNLAMRIVTERMQGLLSDINTTSALLDDACENARDAWDDLGKTFQSISFPAIKTVQQKVKKHLNYGKKGLEKSIKEYENINAQIIKDAERGYEIVIPNQVTKVNTTVDSNGQGVITVTKTGDARYRINTGTPGTGNIDIRNAIESTNLPKQRQIYRADTGEGLCNVSSITMLLNRRYALDHGGSENADWFSLEDVFRGNKCTVRDASGKNVSISGSTGHWYDHSYDNGSGTSYYATCIGSGSVAKKVQEYGSHEEYFAAMLDQHPEGIVIRSGPKNHTVTMTGYSRDEDGTVHIFFDDPVNIAKDPPQSNLEFKDTYLGQKCGGNWNNLGSLNVVYIE